MKKYIIVGSILLALILAFYLGQITRRSNTLPPTPPAPNTSIPQPYQDSEIRFSPLDSNVALIIIEANPDVYGTKETIDVMMSYFSGYTGPVQPVYDKYTNSVIYRYQNLNNHFSVKSDSLVPLVPFSTAPFMSNDPLRDINIEIILENNSGGSIILKTKVIYKPSYR